MVIRSLPAHNNPRKRATNNLLVDEDEEYAMRCLWWGNVMLGVVVSALLTIV